MPALSYGGGPPFVEARRHLVGDAPNGTARSVYFGHLDPPDPQARPGNVGPPTASLALLRSRGVRGRGRIRRPRRGPRRRGTAARAGGLFAGLADRGPALDVPGWPRARRIPLPRTLCRGPKPPRRGPAARDHGFPRGELGRGHVPGRPPRCLRRDCGSGAAHCGHRSLARRARSRGAHGFLAAEPARARERRRAGRRKGRGPRPGRRAGSRPVSRERAALRGGPRRRAEDGIFPGSARQPRAPAGSGPGEVGAQSFLLLGRVLGGGARGGRGPRGRRGFFGGGPRPRPGEPPGERARRASRGLRCGRRLRRLAAARRRRTALRRRRVRPAGLREKTRGRRARRARLQGRESAGHEPGGAGRMASDVLLLGTRGRGPLPEDRFFGERRCARAVFHRRSPGSRGGSSGLARLSRKGSTSRESGSAVCNNVEHGDAPFRPDARGDDSGDRNEGGCLSFEPAEGGLGSGRPGARECGGEPPRRGAPRSAGALGRGKSRVCPRETPAAERAANVPPRKSGSNGLCRHGSDSPDSLSISAPEELAPSRAAISSAPRTAA